MQYNRAVTVPHDAVLCLGFGLAAHLTKPAGEPLAPAARRIAVQSFAAAWLPLTCALLWIWTEWSWWYWEPVLGSKWLALGVGLALECGAFALALLSAGRLRHRTLLGLLGLIMLYEGVMLTVPWSHFALVGSLDELQAGTAAPLFASWDLISTIALGSLWLGIVGLWAARRMRLISAGSDPGTSSGPPG
jgi:hypothetical protein